MTLACVFASVQGGLAQTAPSGSQIESPITAPPLSYSTATTPQYQPATAGGYSTSPAGPRLAGTSQLGGAPVQTQSDLFSTGEGLLQWGIAHLYPHFLYGLSYGNGLQATPGEQANTLINQFSPGLLVRLGPHWTLDYTPTLIWYSSSQFQNAVDQAVSLNGSTTYGDWAFGLSLGYSSTDQPLVETAAQTSQDVFSVGLSAAYQLNSKVFFDFGLNQSLRYVGQNTVAQPSNVPGLLSDVQEWSTLDWVNYQIVPQVSIGLGVGFTYDNVSASPDVITELYQARIQWHAGNKLTFLLSGGLSDQQFLDSGVPDLLTPTYSLTLNYRLFEPTGLYVAGSSGTTPSYYLAQVSQVTSISGGIHQRLAGRLFLDVSGGYSTTAYHGTTTAPNAADISNYSSTSFNVALSTTFFKRLTTSAFYQAAINSSGSTLYNYNTSMVGLTLGYSF
jgi:hypothetical protein